MRPEDEASYLDICVQEGAGAYFPIANGQTTGDMIHYTEYTYTLELSDQMKSVSGFDHLTISEFCLQC